MDAIKRFVNTPDVFEAFKTYLNGKIEVTQKMLEQATKPEDIYRAQGQIAAYRRLLTMRDEINHMDKQHG